VRYEVKYLERLAKVYLDKYEKSGYAEAKSWYDGFLCDDIRAIISPYVEREVARRINNKEGK
jgi:hypothetical protein